MPSDFEMRETIEKPSHLCVASDCKWGRTTMVPGYFISSVGEYVDKGSRRAKSPEGWTEIGLGRLYETFVFKWGGVRCIVPECHCGGLPEPSKGYGEIDSDCANTRDDCIRNHNRLVEKYAALACIKEKNDV